MSLHTGAGQGLTGVGLEVDHGVGDGGEEDGLREQVGHLHQHLRRRKGHLRVVPRRPLPICAHACIHTEHDLLSLHMLLSQSMRVITTGISRSSVLLPALSLSVRRHSDTHDLKPSQDQILCSEQTTAVPQPNPPTDASDLTL